LSSDRALLNCVRPLVFRVSEPVARKMLARSL
jgi:hypothetical protein